MKWDCQLICVVQTLIRMACAVQVAAVAAWELSAEEEEAGGNRDTDSAHVAASLAQQMLLELATDAAHGLAPGNAATPSEDTSAGMYSSIFVRTVYLILLCSLLLHDVITQQLGSLNH